jgi:hypothetical protein
MPAPAHKPGDEACITALRGHLAARDAYKFKSEFVRLMLRDAEDPIETYIKGLQYLHGNPALLDACIADHADPVLQVYGEHGEAEAAWQERYDALSDDARQAYACGMDVLNYMDVEHPDCPDERRKIEELIAWGVDGFRCDRRATNAKEWANFHKIAAGAAHRLWRGESASAIKQYLAQKLLPCYGVGIVKRMVNFVEKLAARTLVELPAEASAKTTPAEQLVST